ncbi:MAG: BatA domain-containing protein, partial [Alphaproteobacteria bacterium]
MPFGPLSFASPWLLLALAVLPALWWLLKITPPAARRTRFPALRLLIGLEAAEETPARTPLWLAILRLVLGAFIIFALAHPIFGGGARFEGNGPVLVVVDDGWTVAPDWAKRQAVLQEILTEAERETRTVAVLTTAPPVSGEAIASPAPLRAAEARKIVQAVTPKPWPDDRAAAAKALEAALNGPAGEALRRPAAVIWLADGLDDRSGSGSALAQQLSKLGALRFVTGDLVSIPHLLLPPETETGRFVAKALRPDAKGSPLESVQLHALDDEGHVLAAQPLVFPASSAHAETALDLPADVANQIARLDIEDEPSAGAVFLIDERWKRRTVGLVSATPQESDRPLLGDLYYLKRALEPFSDVHIGTLGDLLKSGPSVLTLSDSIALTPDDRNALEAWISKGGVLLRFAGAHMAESADLAVGTPADELIPVSLRRGGRALGGVMSWTAPMALAPFDPSSPFAGLAIPSDVTVERQVLAEPSLDLGSKTWAQLADGTPLVTAERRDQGTLILFHITANADWSNLPLSGLFVDMLRRIVALSHG